MSEDLLQILNSLLDLLLNEQIEKSIIYFREKKINNEFTIENKKRGIYINNLKNYIYVLEHNQKMKDSIDFVINDYII